MQCWRFLRRFSRQQSLQQVIAKFHFGIDFRENRPSGAIENSPRRAGQLPPALDLEPAALRSASFMNQQGRRLTEAVWLLAEEFCVS